MKLLKHTLVLTIAGWLGCRTVPAAPTVEANKPAGESRITAADPRPRSRVEHRELRQARRELRNDRREFRRDQRDPGRERRETRD